MYEILQGTTFAAFDSYIAAQCVIAANRAARNREPAWFAALSIGAVIFFWAGCASVVTVLGSIFG